MKDELMKMLLLSWSVFPRLSALLASIKAPLAQYDAEEAGNAVACVVLVFPVVSGGIDLENYQREFK